MTLTEAEMLVRRERYKTNHILHLLLSVLTGGLWLAIWLLVAISNATQRAAIDRQLQGKPKDQNILQAIGWIK